MRPPIGLCEREPEVISVSKTQSSSAQLRQAGAHRLAASLESSSRPDLVLTHHLSRSSTTKRRSPLRAEESFYALFFDVTG